MVSKVAVFGIEEPLLLELLLLLLRSVHCIPQERNHRLLLDVIVSELRSDQVTSDHTRTHHRTASPHHYRHNYG